MSVAVAPSQRDYHIAFDAAGATAVGQKRRRNEDQFVVATIRRSMHIHATSLEEANAVLPSSAEGTLLLVADGMGGHGGGDVASSIASRALVGYLSTVLPWFDAQAAEPRDPTESLSGVRDGLNAALRSSDRAVRRAAAQPGGIQGMGTTMTVAYAHFPLLYVAHVGDSRAYLLRGNQLHRLTRDHTVADELAEAMQQPVEDDSPYHHVLTKAIGGGGQTHSEPDIRRADLELGDVILLCSDGLTKHVGDDEIARLLGASEAAETIADRLVALANERGGSDNITVVVARSIGNPS
jgi:serine/threonine protein phosphatase PrpC